MQQENYHSNKIIGIDPGKSGGICMIEENRLWSEKCPDNPLSMSSLFKDMIKEVSPSSIRVFLEKVWARPSDGRVSVFTFAQNYGQWEGVISSFGIEPEYVIPATWMKHCKVPTGLSKQERKNYIKHLAKELMYKNEYMAYCWKGVPTLATADAIMITKYGLDKTT